MHRRLHCVLGQILILKLTYENESFHRITCKQNSDHCVDYRLDLIGGGLLFDGCDSAASEIWYFMWL